jgi:hypothetical protein
MEWTRPKRLLSYIFGFFLFLYSALILAAPLSKYGATLSIPVLAKEPTPIHGYQMMVNYNPDSLIWKQLRLYFDCGFSYLSTHSTHHSVVNIYSAAPVIRYTFERQRGVSPYLELSIGLSYLNQTRFDGRNLGIHMAFQDRAGIGVLLGQSERFSLGVHAVHYSNARLSEHNSGITAPLVVDVGYRF